MLYGSHTGVEEQVAAGDAGVDGALADIDGDVSRAQEEQLDAAGLWTKEAEEALLATR